MKITEAEYNLKLAEEQIAEQKEIIKCLLEACEEVEGEMRFDAKHNNLDDIHQCLYNKTQAAIAKARESEVKNE